MNAPRIAASALLLAGSVGPAACTAGPNYTPPRTNAPPAWSESLAGGATDGPTDVRRWWTTLNDPTLDSLVTRAVAANLDLRLAEARVREARAQRGIAASALLPGVDAKGSYSRLRSSANTTSGVAVTGGDSTGSGGTTTGTRGQASDLFIAGFDASWELDLFGGVRRSVEAADADIDSTEEARHDVLVTLVSEVARNYVELRSFQNRLGIAQANVKAQEDTLGLTRARFDAGLTSELDTTRAQSNLETTRSQIPTLETGVKQAVHRLGVLLGQNPGALSDELAGAGPIPSAPSQVPVGLPSDLLRRRPDIRGAERDLAGATARIGVATADLFPRVTLTGSVALESSRLASLFEGDSLAYSVGPGVRWRVFDAGKVRNNIRVQDARAAQALARYDRAVLTAFEDVENALVAYSREQVRRGSLALAVAAAQRSVQLSNDLYTRGLTDFQNVLDAQRDLYTLQDQLVQSERTVTANLIALYKALGGGWESADAGT